MKAVPSTRVLGRLRGPRLYVDAAFILPYLKPVGTAIRTHASSHRYGFGVVFTSHALELKLIEGAVQETASIKRH